MEQNAGLKKYLLFNLLNLNNSTNINGFKRVLFCSKDAFKI